MQMDRLDRLNSTLFPGHVSVCHVTKGSWFIQALCYELQEKGTSDDILTILTRANRVAIDETESPIGMHIKKQMPYISNTLTRRLIFTRK
jgi:hypothetical protein